ncbi:hypothetical protein Salat_1771300 [Sesamum alatum]|uniref:Uncharacterized protein n=1 Tax=Sesamum alatum TaxID=300844 RepID=A0AAE1Y9Z6_9LAMI|nr:hypothetical protein Salat_1771300 [Sesamum alatum]
MAYDSHFLAAAIIMIFLALSLPSHQLSLETPVIAAAPALLPNPPLSPYTELPPDIAPLLPSPGGTARSPAQSSMPTIPSTRSPNPDTLTAIGPDAAVAPSGSVQDSSAVSVKGLTLDVFYGCLAYWLVVFFMI